MKGENGKRELITICDTPGFGDTKGIEMEISSGLGIIHALKGAASIKPVIVIDHNGMNNSKFAPLRKTLSTVIAMMGCDSIDFSPFSYIFTRCEGRTSKRISKQLAGFQNGIRLDPTIENKDILDALLTDMISKTKPEDVICIDPEEPDDAPDTLARLWRGPRLDNPANTFVNFASKESMAALLLQVKVLLSDLDSSLQITDLDLTEVHLKKLTKLADVLSLSEINKAAGQGIVKTMRFLNQLSSDIENLMIRLVSEFEETLNALLSKLHLVAKTGSIYDICGTNDFDYNTFIDDIAERLFSTVRKSIFDVNPSIPGDAKSLQQSTVQFDLLENLLQGLVSNDKLQNEHAITIEAYENLLDPAFKALDFSLHQVDPLSTTLQECLPKLNFILAMKDYFFSSHFLTTNLDLLELAWDESGFKNIIEHINEKSKSCGTCLDDLDKTLHKELLGDREWSYSSVLKLNDSAEYKECRDFLQAVVSSKSLVAMIYQDSNQDFERLFRDFDEYIKKYLQGVVDFLQGQSQAIFDNEIGKITDRINKNQILLDVIDSVLAIAIFDHVKMKLYSSLQVHYFIRFSHSLIHSVRSKKKAEGLKYKYSIVDLFIASIHTVHLETD